MLYKKYLFIIFLLSIFIISACQKEAVGKPAPTTTTIRTPQKISIVTSIKPVHGQNIEVGYYELNIKTSAGAICRYFLTPRSAIKIREVPIDEMFIFNTDAQDKYNTEHRTPIGVSYGRNTLWTDCRIRNGDFDIGFTNFNGILYYLS